MHHYKAKNINNMKKLLFIVALIGFFSLTSCGAQEDCRGRANHSKITKQNTDKMLAINYIQEK